MTEWAWRRFACGVWAAGEFGAFQAQEWAACLMSPFELPDGARGPFVGVDLGLRWDCTAIVPVWLDPGGWREELVPVPGRPGLSTREWVPADTHPTAYVGVPVVLVPPRDGTSLSVDVIFAACEAMTDGHPGAVFAVDPAAGGEHLSQRLDAELGAEIVVVSNSHGSMCRASMRLAEAIVSGRLRHAGDDTLTQHVLNAGVRQVAEAWRIAKQPGSSAPVDAAVALAMGLTVALDADAEPPREPSGGYRVGGWY
jgi:hypothetical protein